MTDLLNVDDALRLILDRISPLDPEAVALPDSLDRVLAADISSLINLPPFAYSSMDGFAVRAEDVTSASPERPVQLDVVMDIQAGDYPREVLQRGQAARIMTGAPIPDGATAIVPVEDTDAIWTKGKGRESPASSVGIQRAVAYGAYIRPVGEDLRQGDLVLKAGTLIRPQEMGILAALGHAQVLVTKRPRVAVLSNGNELVAVDQELSPGKIRDVNSYTLAGLITQVGAEPVVLPVAADTEHDVRQLFQTALKLRPSMILSSAGVSVGAADLVRDIMKELGEIGFWRINLQPGKPLAFGTLQDVPFFGLPGNPVSVMVTFDVLVRPALLRQAGRPDILPMVEAVAGEKIETDGRRSYLRVRLNYAGDQLVATTTGTQSSGALMSMVLADGLMIVPEDVMRVHPGDKFKVRLLRPRADWVR